MKARTIVNSVIIFVVLAVPASIILPSYISFYLSGKEEFEGIAEEVHARCNSEQKCPEYLDGWSPGHSPVTLRKGHMYYYYYPSATNVANPNEKEGESFRLVFGLAGPDHWYEASGGVGEQIQIGWKSR